MRYQLVLQFPEEVLQLDRLVELEEMLAEALGAEAEIDGHDLGSGEANIFITTDDPDETFRNARALLEGEKEFRRLRAAFRPLKSGTYTILWPKGLDSFRVT